MNSRLTVRSTLRRIGVRSLFCRRPLKVPVASLELKAGVYGVPLVNWPINENVHLFN